MNIEIIFANLLLAVPIYAFAHRAIQKQLDWKETLKLVTVYGGAIFLFWTFHQWVEFQVANTVTGILNSSKDSRTATVISAVLIGGIFFMLWWALNTLILKPKSKLETICIIAAAVIGGTAAGLIFWGSVDKLVDYAPVFVTEFGFFLAAAIIAYWKSKLQNLFAVAVALIISVVLTCYFWYCYTGINILMYVQTANSLTYWLILFSILFTFSTVLDKGKPWNKRISYKIINCYLVILLTSSLGFGFINFFGSHAKERRIKAQVNMLQKIVLDKTLEQHEKTTVLKGVNSNYAKAVIVHPEQYDLEQAETALKQQQTVAINIEKAVYEAPIPRPIYNEPKINKFFKKFKILPWNWNSNGTGKGKGKKTVLSLVKKYEFEVTCIGFKGGVDDMGGVETPLTNGIHYNRGYYLEAIGNPGFEVWHGARYRDYQGRYFKQNQSTNSGSNFTVRGPKGAKVLVRSYKKERVVVDT